MTKYTSQMGGELEAKLFVGPNKYKTIEEWISFFSKEGVDNLTEFLHETNLELVIPWNYVERDVDKVAIGQPINRSINPFFKFDDSMYKQFWDTYFEDYYIVIHAGLSGDFEI